MEIIIQLGTNLTKYKKAKKGFIAIKFFYHYLIFCIMATSFLIDMYLKYLSMNL